MPFIPESLQNRLYDVCSIENALVDLLVNARDEDVSRLGMNKGIMQLVERDVQTNALDNLGNCDVEIEVGGSAANATRGCAILGACASYSSTVGRDKYGKAFTDRLTDLKIENRVVFCDEHSTGTCLILVTPDGERTMNTHLGACRIYKKGYVPESDIRNSKILFTTGYIWDTPDQIEAIEHAIAVAHEAGTKMALDVADPFAVTRSREHIMRHINGGHVNVLFANAEESKMMVGESGAKGAEIMAKLVDVVAVKDGARGAYIGSKEGVIHIPAESTKVVDTTGAGDMFAGGFLYGLIRGYPLELCGIIASILAADTISGMGVKLAPNICERVNARVDAWFEAHPGVVRA